MRHSARGISVVLVALLAGCAVGPGHHTPAPPPAGRAVVGPAADTLRSFYDSLAARTGVNEMRGSPLLPGADTLQEVAWMDLLRDSTLLELVRVAVRENKDVQQAQARVKEYRALVGAEKGALYPQLEGNGVVGTQRVVFGSLGTASFDYYRVTADLAWELDFWGRIRRGVSAARADYQARDADARATLLTLISDVATAYIELRELDADLAVAERTLASRQETLRLAQRRFDQGVISELDVRGFEAAVAQPAARVAQFQRLRAQKEHQLSVLLGQAPRDIPRGRPLAEAVHAVDVPDSVSSTLIVRRPDVQSAERELAAETARVGVAVGNRLPRFTVTGQYGRQSEEPDVLFKSQSEIYLAQAGVSIPLFTGGTLVNRERAQKARVEQARYQYDQTVLIALREVGDALIGVRTSKGELAAQRLQVQALRRALQLAERRYENGLSSYLEVLDTQRSLFDAEIAVSQTERQYLVSAVQLYKAIGGTWTETEAGQK